MKGKIGAFFTAIIIVILVVCGFKCSKTIPAGYAGIVYNLNGGIEKDVLRQGWRIVDPTKTITLYSIALEQSYMTEGDQGDSNFLILMILIDWQKLLQDLEDKAVKKFLEVLLNLRCKLGSKKSHLNLV